ncbi:hypothetical protein GCM10010446_65460 [Streptomyces enissocaesilis]|uniref:Transposase n=1 Tax=Streptomyces enissocaesilis TaxID=332589 RepID=A0ABP6K4J5_9ACTN
MRISESIRDQLALKFEVLFPHLGERQRRLLMATEARLLGHGGIRAVAQAAQVSETTIRKGVDELESGAKPLGRVRRPGGGRKKAADDSEWAPGRRPSAARIQFRSVSGFTSRSPATDLTVAPGLERYNATASALKSAG